MVLERVLAVLAAVLLLPALVVTGARLGDPTWGRLVQLVAFAPLALPLYAGGLALLVLLVVAQVRRRHRGSATALAATTALVALAGLVLHAAWFAPQVVGETPAAAEGAEPVVVMTSNLLFGRADAAALVAQVRRDRVSVLVTSELTDPALAALEEAGIDDLLPHRVGSAGPEDSVQGTAVFADAPVELVEQLDLFSTGLLVRTEPGMTLLAVHPAPPTLPEQWRADQAAIREAARRWSPDLVVGDLNATPDHAPLRALGRLGYRDAAELTNAGWAPTWPVGDTFPLLGLLGPVAQIDHVLVADGFTATASSRSVVADTDHAVVRAVVVRAADVRSAP